MTTTPTAPGARLYLRAVRARRPRAAAHVVAITAAGGTTVAAVVLFLATLELARDLPASRPYSEVYVLAAGAGPLAVLLHGLGVLMSRRRTDHSTLDPAGRTRGLGGGLACNVFAGAAALLTPLVTSRPSDGRAWITRWMAVFSLAVTLLLMAASAVALHGGTRDRVSRR